jgi:hypothetical protein
MNLNKFTKTELISKIKNIESKKDSKPSLTGKNHSKNILNVINNYFSQI